METTHPHPPHNLPISLLGFMASSSSTGATERLLQSPARPTEASTDGVAPLRSKSAKKLDKKLRVITREWRELALAWQRQHAPQTAYERLVRASVSEMRPEERAAIRRDVQRSQPVSR